MNGANPVLHFGNTRTCTRMLGNVHLPEKIRFQSSVSPSKVHHPYSVIGLDMIGWHCIWSNASVGVLLLAPIHAH